MSLCLTVFVRSGCHLCDDMLVALDEYRSGQDFDLEVIDILGKAELEARYGSRIPVLKAGDEEVCYYFLDETALQQYFGNI